MKYLNTVSVPGGSPASAHRSPVAGAALKPNFGCPGVLCLDMLDQRGLRPRLVPAARASAQREIGGPHGMQRPHRFPSLTCDASCAAKSKYGTRTPHCLHLTCSAASVAGQSARRQSLPHRRRRVLLFVFLHGRAAFENLSTVPAREGALSLRRLCTNLEVPCQPGQGPVPERVRPLAPIPVGPNSLAVAVVALSPVPRVNRFGVRKKHLASRCQTVGKRRRTLWPRISHQTSSHMQNSCIPSDRASQCASLPLFCRQTRQGSAGSFGG